MALTPHQTYSNTSVMTASPGDLTLMLYNGAIRFLKQGKTAMEQNNVQDTHHHITKVQAILNELMGTLNLEYEIGRELMSLYEFMHRHLLQGVVKKDPALLQEVMELLEDLRNTWNEMLKASRTPQVAGVQGV